MTRQVDSDKPSSIETLIEGCNAGEAAARQQLAERFYTELRRIAAAQLRAERPNHTLQCTALVHEAYTRFAKQSKLHLADRSHFLALASHLMRQILVDYARARGASKRGGPHRQQVTLDEALIGDGVRRLDVLVLDQALRRLSQLDARHGRVVELHFFGGLTFAEIARVVGVAERTVKRDWDMARAWLRSELSAHP